MARLTRVTRKRLGEILLAEGLLSKKQLDGALERQEQHGLPLGQVLVTDGIVSEEDIAAVICRQFSLPYIDPRYYELNDNVKGVFPEQMMRRFMCVPIDRMGDTLLVITSRVPQLQVLEELEDVSGCRVHVCIGTATAVQDMIDQHFRSRDDTLTSLGSMLLGEEGD